MAKKSRISGDRIMDIETGEIYVGRDFMQSNADKGFLKLFLEDFRKRLGEVDTKTAVALHLISKGSNGYVVNESMEEISKELGISMKSTQRALTSLEKTGMLKRKGERQIVINPRSVFKGNNYRRHECIKAYDDIE